MFLSVLVPVFARTKDIGASLGKALPLLLVSMCTFIINDLEDIEKDKFNHPERPLPSGQVKPAFVAILYYVCLASALITIRSYVTASHIAFWYYLLLTVSISYGNVVEFLSSFKSAYVAAAVSIPVVILVSYYPQEVKLYSIAAAVFVCTLGRELCMDLRDRPGDPVSFLHRIESKRIAWFAFGSQSVGLFLVALQIEGATDLLVVLAMTLLFALSYLCWFKLARLKSATALMKAVIFLGLYFLI